MELEGKSGRKLEACIVQNRDCTSRWTLESHIYGISNYIIRPVLQHVSGEAQDRSTGTTDSMN